VDDGEIRSRILQHEQADKQRSIICRQIDNSSILGVIARCDGAINLS
jgi:hypothetical protein